MVGAQRLDEKAEPAASPIAPQRLLAGVDLANVSGPCEGDLHGRRGRSGRQDTLLGIKKALAVTVRQVVLT